MQQISQDSNKSYREMDASRSLQREDVGCTAAVKVEILFFTVITSSSHLLFLLDLQHLCIIIIYSDAVQLEGTNLYTQLFHCGFEGTKLIMTGPP